MEPFKITDIKEEMIELGKKLYAENVQKYPSERVEWMRNSIKQLATESLNKDFTIDELFYLSIYDYWVYGNTISEEIYFHFPYKTHKEKSEYMTFRSRLKLMKRINNFEDSYLFNNKYETYKLFKDSFLRDVVKISDESDFNSFASFVEKHREFVIKPTSSHLGIGVRKMTVEKDVDKVELFHSLLQEGKKLSSDSFNQDSSFLLEELIEQDSRLAAIHPYSVNGIRITTLRLDNEVKILYPWFKVGANKSFVTSAAFGTYDAGIDAETGIVYTDGYKENGEHDAEHPLTKIQFKGYQIPEWNELLQLVKNLSDRIPTVRYIGWDMVLTPKGWCIMEGNFTGDFMWQMFNEKGFKKEFETLTGIRQNSDFWWQ